MKLHNYFRSTSSYRVRIACALKALPYDYQAWHLNRNGGEHLSAEFAALNPQALVPTLEDDDGFRVSQSLAILEYLEERHPQPPLLPADMHGRARVREVAQYIACEMHPLNNLRVHKFLGGALKLDDAAKQQWITHWMRTGLAALERSLAKEPTRGAFCYGDTPTLADCCLIPQLFSAQRFGVDLAEFPTLDAIDKCCAKIEAFQSAHPARQPDAEPAR